MKRFVEETSALSDDGVFVSFPLFCSKVGSFPQKRNIVNRQRKHSTGDIYLKRTFKQVLGEC